MCKKKSSLSVALKMEEIGVGKRESVSLPDCCSSWTSREGWVVLAMRTVVVEMQVAAAMMWPCSCRLWSVDCAR